MAVKWHFMVLLFLFVGCTSSSKTTTSANKGVDFLTQIERQDWKQEIDGGNIGFFNPSTNTLVGLDEPPHNSRKSNIQPDLNLSKECREFADQNNKVISELEFVVDKNGEPRQFFVLESAGPCDKDTAASLKNLNLIPAKKDGQNKAALVHFRITLDHK